MSCCNSITGITFSCLANSGGVREIFIACYDSVSGATVSNGLVTGITMEAGQTFHQFQFNKKTSSITEEASVNLENGVTFYTQTVTLVIPYREVSKRNSILLLADGQPNLHVIVRDYNDNYWWVGNYAGANLTGLTTGSGTAKDDLNGYTITLVAEEPYLAYEVDSAVIPTII
jgi:hypothetical protein